MKLQAYRLQNYRRLRDVVIELDDQISIFVGANNSGKTSAVQGLFAMLRGDAKKFELFDFSTVLWAKIDAIGKSAPGNEDAAKGLPSIVLDIWFRVDENDLATAMSLLPSTDWDGKCVGIRVAFEPLDANELLHRFHELHEKANNAAAALNTNGKGNNTSEAEAEVEDSEYKPWPATLTKYLTKTLSKEYTFRYYLLDERAFVEPVRISVWNRGHDIIPKGLFHDRSDDHQEAQEAKGSISIPRRADRPVAGPS